MFRPSVRYLVLGATLLLASATSHAQFFRRGCNCGGPASGPIGAAAPIFPATAGIGGYDPCNICGPAVAFNPCAQCAPPVVMQPVQQTVYREVPVTKYRPVQKTVKKPVIRTVYEQRPVTAYKQVVEQKTVNVPVTNYQTVTECQPRTANLSRWQTTYQRVPKASPCQYDPNPTLLGWMNRNAYALRMALTPNYRRHRQYVPRMVAYNVPVNRVVAVPSTRQMTYNVAKMVPYETTQTVAVNKVEYEDTTVTAYEPYTEMQTVAVGTSTQYAFVNPLGGSGTATALNPVPDTQIRSAQNPTPNNNSSGATNPPTADTTDDLFKPLSHPQPRQIDPEPEPTPTYFDARHQQDSPVNAVSSIANSDGWRPSRSAKTPGPKFDAGEVEVVVAARQ